MSEEADNQLPLAVTSAWTATGDVRVDSAVELLSGLRELPISEHQQVFEDVQRRLQQALADTDGR